MGGINFRQGEFVSIVSETVGFKSGLALNADELCSHTPAEYQDVWHNACSGKPIRLRAETFDNLVRRLLVNLGAASRDALENPSIVFAQLVQCEPERAEMIEAVNRKAVAWLFDSMRSFFEGNCEERVLDPIPFYESVENEFGGEGLEIAHRFILAMHGYTTADPWSQIRRIDWNDRVELKELFESEGVEPSHGRFIDQRFIDYLNEHVDCLDEMHWRKFEALTGEFFEEAGFDVNLGPGRDDGGIDVRAWWTEGGQESLVIVQCKRQQRKVGKTVVKAVHADTEYEGAELGLIVSLNGLLPGAKEMARARSYNVADVDREDLRKWLKALRSPGVGESLLMELK